MKKNPKNLQQTNTQTDVLQKLIAEAKALTLEAKLLRKSIEKLEGKTWKDPKLLP